MSDAIRNGLIIGAVSAMFAVLMSLARKKAPVDAKTGTHVIQHSGMIKVVAILGFLMAILFGLGTIILTFVGEKIKPETYYIAVIVTLIFGLAGGYLYLETKRRKVLLNEDGVIASSLFGKITSLSWAEIEKIEFHRFGQQFVIQGIHGTKLKIPMMMQGLASLADFCQKYLDASVYKNAVPGFQILGVEMK